MECPHQECSIELIRLPAIVEGTKKEIWLHPENPHVKCPYANDGTKLNLEVVDPFMCQKFQELILESKQESPLKVQEKTIEETKEVGTTSNLDKIKTRLCEGLIDIPAFKEIKLILEEK